MEHTGFVAIATGGSIQDEGLGMKDKGRGSKVQVRSRDIIIQDLRHAI